MNITANPPLRPLKWYANLHKARERKSQGFFMVEGLRAVQQIAGNLPEAMNEILYVDQCPPWAAGLCTRQVNEKQMRQICASTTPQGLAAVLQLPDDVYSNRLPDVPGKRILILDDIQDPGNVGTLIRSAAAFDFDGVLLSEGSADPFGPKAVQATAGALGGLWIRKTSALLQAVRTLHDNGKPIVVADVHATAAPAALAQYTDLLLLLGNEAKGPSPHFLELADTAVCIPMNSAKIESLNVAVSGAILMSSCYHP